MEIDDDFGYFGDLGKDVGFVFKIIQICGQVRLWVLGIGYS